MKSIYKGFVKEPYVSNAFMNCQWGKNVQPEEALEVLL